MCCHTHGCQLTSNTVRVFVCPDREAVPSGPSVCLRHQAARRALRDRRQHGMEGVPMLCLWSGHMMVPSLSDVLLLYFSCSLWAGWGIRGEQAGHVHAKNDLIVPGSRGVGNRLWSMSSTSQQLHSAFFFGGRLNVQRRLITAMVSSCLKLEVFWSEVYICLPGCVDLLSKS